MSDVDQQLPLWAQVTLAVWAVGTVAIFVRQLLTEYAAAFPGG